MRQLPCSPAATPRDHRAFLCPGELPPLTSLHCCAVAFRCVIEEVAGRTISGLQADLLISLNETAYVLAIEVVTDESLQDRPNRRPSGVLEGRGDGVGTGDASED